MTAPPPSPRDLRFFGLVMLLALAYGAFRAHRRGLPPALSAALIAGGGVLLLLSFVAPAIVRPLYRAWMALGLLMGKITTPIIMALLFGLVFVPTRAVLALTGRDPLGMRPRRSTASWWVERKKAVFAPEDFQRLS